MTWLGSDIGFKDGPHLDGFNNLKVSTENTQFDSQPEYGLDALHLWDITANGTLPSVWETNGSVSSGGNAVGPRDANTRMTPVTVSATDTHYAILQGKSYVRYVPGHAHVIKMTGVFAAGASATASIVLRSSTSGSVVDTSVAQASWNVDKFTPGDLNPSGITLDFTKIQILVIDAQMLYAGRVRVGFSVNGSTYWAHYFNIANAQAVATVQTFNLPVRMEGRTGPSSTTFRTGYFDAANGVFLETTRASTGGTCQFECCSVQSCSGNEPRGQRRHASNGITTIAVTTRRPVMSIRPREIYNAITNRGHIEFASFSVLASTNAAYIEIVQGGTLTGASWLPSGSPITAGSFVSGVRYIIRSIGTTDFTLIGASANTVGLSFVATGVGAGTGTAVVESTIAEYDVSASAIVGGEVLGGIFVPASIGVTTNVAAGELDARFPLVLSKIDSLAATQTPLTIVATSFTGTSNVAGAMSWFEQTV